MTHLSPLKAWQKVWEKKGTEAQGIALSDLIAADGFDGGAGKMTEAVWLDLVEQIKSELRLEVASSLLEVGCGSGALLLPLSSLPIKLAGVDYSSSFVGIAQKAIKGLEARVAEAAALPFPDESFSRVISHGVFHYFPDEAYVEKALAEMLRVLEPEGGILIADIPDLAKKEASEELRRSLAQQEGKNYLTTANSDYSHLYLSKEFFVDFFQGKGFVPRIFDQRLAGYGNAPFRFNVTVWKQ